MVELPSLRDWSRRNRGNRVIVDRVAAWMAIAGWVGIGKNRRLRIVLSQVPKCAGPPPRERRPVRGDPGPGAPIHQWVGQIARSGPPAVDGNCRLSGNWKERRGEVLAIPGPQMRGTWGTHSTVSQTHLNTKATAYRNSAGTLPEDPLIARDERGTAPDTRMSGPPGRLK